MTKYILRKLLVLIPKLLVISLIIFFALNLLPGDPITRTLSPQQLEVLTEPQLEAMRQSLGLNKPLLVQYFSWLGRLLQGDFGYSQSTGSNIAIMLATRLPYTMELAAWALVFSSLLGILFGFAAATHKNSFVDYSCTTFGVIGTSVPEFFFGVVFILLFALKLKWFPTGGRMDPKGSADFISRFPYIVMPAFTLAIALMATQARYTRGSVLDVLNKDYIKTARSKGLSETTVNVKHALRNALTPVMVLIVSRLPALVSGTVVIETVFNYPAMGSMVLDAISAGDMPVVMITTMVISIVTLLASTLIDMVTALLDPRVRLD
ncbi:MAG: ABC transporter permease [Oscillospiraceae bacterium]|nr:ABC transporter permease [Oscillospiraceae bacterium]